MPPSARHSPLLALAWLPLLALLAAALQGSAAPGLALSVVSVLCVLAIGLSCYEQHVDAKRRQTVARVTGLFYYPVKSCAGVPLQRAVLAKHGFARDRTFMIADKKFNFISQRQHPKLALIRPRFFSGAEEVTADLTKSPTALRLEAPGQPPLMISLQANRGGRGVGAVAATVTLWDTPLACLELAGQGAEQWLQRYLGVEQARLVQCSPRHRRALKLASNMNAAADRGLVFPAFSDEFPLLLATAPSLQRLQDWLDGTQDGRGGVCMRNFRPNIVVDGDFAAFEEDFWDRVLIGPQHASIHLSKPCQRCTVPTIDQATAVRAKSLEPFKTLCGRHGSTAGDKPYFGQQGLHLKADVGSVIAVGDAVVVADTFPGGLLGKIERSKGATPRSMPGKE